MCEVSQEIENVPDEISEPTVSEVTMSKKQLYIAYGSNINLEQMAHSKVVGTSEIKGFELEFRGVATIVPKDNASVPVLICEIENDDGEIVA